MKSANLVHTLSLVLEQILQKFGFLFALCAVLGLQGILVKWTATIFSRGLSNTPKLSPMEEGHEQPDSPDDSSRET